jgi:hypothetical protein
VNVSRAQVLSYRLLRHGLSGPPPADALLALGVQDTPVGAAAQALSVRSLPGDGLATVWSFRGAPHRVAGSLPALSAALWPVSEIDAIARLAGFGTTLKKAGLSGVEAIAVTAFAVASVVTGPTVKGDLSAAVTRAVPDAYSFWCRGCDATHVHDQLLRLSALHGGVRLESQSPVTFVPVPRWKGVPSAASGVERLVAAYLTLHGPATLKDVAGFFGSTGPAFKPAWPGSGLAEVSVDGKKAYLPEESVSELRSASPMRGVRLLPPSDPYLQARDRELLVPAKEHRAALWTVLAGPGAVVADGEVAGVWRAKQGPKGRLDVTVTPFGSLGPRVRPEVASEAERVAGVRGAASVAVTYAD